MVLRPANLSQNRGSRFEKDHNEDSSTQNSLPEVCHAHVSDWGLVVARMAVQTQDAELESDPESGVPCVLLHRSSKTHVRKCDPLKTSNRRMNDSAGRFP